MTSTTSSDTKRRPPVSVKLPDDLENYLRERAKHDFRSLSKEIVMRLEQSRKAQEAGHAQAA